MMKNEQESSVRSDQIYKVDPEKFKKKVRQKPIFIDQLARLERKRLLAKKESFSTDNVALYTLEINKLLLQEGVVVSQKSEHSHSFPVAHSRKKASMEN
jgi:hypothetical protein